MGFFHQLLVLLWKNWTIKKRCLWVTIFEMTTPIALFLILVGLRTKAPVTIKYSGLYHPKPLPSAGMVAVLQAFCPLQDGTDEYGYYIHKNSMVSPFLDHLYEAWMNNNSADGDLDFVKVLSNFNQAWKHMEADSRNVDSVFPNSGGNGLQLHQILKNETEFKEFLMKNTSASPQEASSLLNSTINFDDILNEINVAHLTSPTERSLSALSRRKRNSPLSSIPDSFAKTLPGLTKHGMTQNVTSIAEALLKNNNKKNPVWSSLSGDQMQQQQIVSKVSTTLLQPDKLRQMMCNPPYDLISVTSNATAPDNITKRNLCNSNGQTEFKSLSKELLPQLNNTALLKALKANDDVTVGKYRKHIFALVEDLKELYKLEKYINSLAHIAEIVPANSCVSFQPPSPIFNHTTNDTQEYLDKTNSITSYGNESTAHHPSMSQTTPNPHHSTAGKAEKPDYLSLWLSMQPLICGQNKKMDLEYLKHENNSKIQLTRAQKNNLGLLLHVLTSNPKILYAPNDTQVEELIENANTSFAIIDNITKTIDNWKKLSKKIRKTLDSSNTSEALDSFRNLKQIYRSNPEYFGNLTTNEPKLHQFLITNSSLLNVTRLHKQLDDIDNAACGWKKFVSGISLNWFKGFSSEEEAVVYATSKAYQDNVTVFATLVFQVDENGNLPPHVTYKIRQNASFTQDTKQIRLSYWRPEPYAWNFLYYNFGFVWLQDVIERSIMWSKIGRDVVSPGAYVHEMPYPCFKFDTFAMNLEHIIPLSMIISWVYTVAMFVQHIVYEKERRLKEVMKMMGLSNGVHWLAWFISIFLQLEITVTVITLLLKFGIGSGTGILPKSNFFIVWLFFTVYAAATIMFCFLVSVLFSKAKVASACSGIIYFMSYLPFAYMSIQEFVLHEAISSMAKLGGSLFSTTALGLGAKYFAVYEQSGYGIQWDNIALSPVEGDTFSLLQALYMLLVDIVLYSLLTWYIEAVFPGQYGLPKPFYFPLTLSYWFGHGESDSECCNVSKMWRHLTQPGYHSIVEEDQIAAMEAQNDANVEPVPTHLTLGVSIQKLTKIYKKGGKKAVNKLSLDFYENQITSFLGHNGAGKTTTISILTGLFPPTSGTAYIYGCDIRSDMLSIRKSLGMCPQHNALFDVLTVEEHLWFYTRLKGVASKEILKEMDQFLIDVGLENKRHCKVNTLSGGTKRKLSVAIAFVGGSRTVILDEPTAGVDPYARRAIWDLIIKYKKGRTILLSTHHMDEADLLGDRIAIISNGKLQCCGSSLFLKSMYGNGYSFTLLKKQSTDDEEEAPLQSVEGTDARENKLTKFVHQHVPTARMTFDSSNQTSFNLPFEAARKGCFHNLFDELPRNMEDLKVTSYGLSDTTLEEVFLKVDERTRWESEGSTMPEKGEKAAKNESVNSFQSSSPDLTYSCYGRNAALEKNESDDEVGGGRCNNESPGCSYANESCGDRRISPTRDEGHTRYRDYRERRMSENLNENQPQTSTNVMESTTNEYERAETALEWLNVESSTYPDQTNNLKTIESEDEHLLLDFAFGDSTFTRPCEESTVNGSINPTPENPAEELTAAGVDDDVELLDLSEDNEGKGSYELTALVWNLRIIQGLLMKRFHYARRSRKAIFYQIMLPALFVSIAMTVALSIPKAGDPPPLVLSPSQYHNVTQPKGNFIAYSDQSVIFPLKKISSLDFKDAGPKDIISTFSMVSGVGATCVLKNHSRLDLNETNMDLGNVDLILGYFNPECQSSFTRGIPKYQFVPPVVPKVTPGSNESVSLTKEIPCKCAADGYTYVCRKGYGKNLPVTKVVTGDRLIEVTGFDPILPYLEYTTDDYRLHRYGALSFGEVRRYVKQDFPGWPSPLRKVAVRDAAQVIYNHKGFHSMPIYLNVLNNALLRANLPKSKGNPAAYGITVINHPMNKTAGALSFEFLRSGSDVIMAIFIIVALSFVPASFLIFLVAERQSRAKHLQFISGTGPVSYWLANYIWDMLNYLFPAFLCIIILHIFNLPAYTRGVNAYAVLALFLLYGWSMTPMMYPASFYFTVPSTAYVCLIVINMFVGITTVVTTFIISLFHDNESFNALNDKLEVAFLIFPNYNLGRGLMDLTYIEYMNEFNTKIGRLDKIISPFQWNYVSRQLVSMAIEGFVGFAITLLFEVRFFTRRSSKPSCTGQSRHSCAPKPEDVDVANERYRVEQIRPQSNEDEMIVVDNISKVYNKKQGEVLAVDKLSFCVGRGECFGLLGVNGAGKTTTFHMITGASGVTNGDIRIAGHHIATGRAHERLLAQHSTGYCPQFNALFDELTPVEHLLLYARLRGVPSKDEKRVADWAVTKLDLLQHKDKPARELSGGNRRKLSVAIALVGYPSVILLDEPTAGMDPGARRFLWDLILDVTKSGRSVLLTSHSMEECEALCGRIAIMVNGRFECLGPTQHLKNRFGDGYMVSVRSVRPNLIVETFAEEFPRAILKEQRYHKVVFQLSFLQEDTSSCLSRVFKLLEDRRDELKIEDYSVSQATLDDVFINFAKNQQSEVVERSAVTWKERFATLKSRHLSRIQRPNLFLRRGPPTSQRNRNLFMRGNPNNSYPELSGNGEDEGELDEEDQPLYDFNQSMTLSFLDSTC